MNTSAKKLIRTIKSKLASQQGRPASMGDVARAVGVSRVSIGNWENGKFEITEASMKRLEETISKLNGRVASKLPVEVAPRHKVAKKHPKSAAKVTVKRGKSKLAEALSGVDKQLGPAKKQEQKASQKRKLGIPVWTGMKIPNESAELEKVKKFITSVGIKPYNHPTGVVRDDGKVYWQFVAEFTPKSMDTIIKLHNDHNRTVGVERSKQYAQDMHGEDWGFTGEPILFNEHGHLLDGQNRLNAGRAYGRPLVFSVGFGLSNTAAGFMGRGYTRSNNHQVQMEGWDFVAVRTATVGLIHRFETSDEDHDYLEQNGQGVKFRGARCERLNSHYADELGPVVRFVHGLRWGIGRAALSKHVAAFMLMLMSRRSVHAARYFMLALVDATHALPGSPIYALRVRLMKLANEKVQAPGKHRQNVSQTVGRGVDTNALVSRATEAIVMRTIASAWNSFCSAKKNTTGKFRVSTSECGSTSEALRNLATPGKAALKEAEALTDETLQVIERRAAACLEKEKRTYHAKNCDEGDVKLDAIKRALEI